jgi:hypothetical protein
MKAGVVVIVLLVLFAIAVFRAAAWLIRDGYRHGHQGGDPGNERGQSVTVG